MPRYQQRIDAVCPICGKKHTIYKRFGFTGTGTPYLNCLECQSNLTSYNPINSTPPAGEKKNKNTWFCSVLKKRGLSREQKIKLDRSIELMSYKFRKERRMPMNPQ